MRLVNVTPHKICIHLGRVDDLTFEPSGDVARVALVTSDGDPLFGIPVVESRTGEIVGLPSPEAGVVYIASMPTAQAAAALGRTDVVCPDTGATCIRENGLVVAVTRLQRFLPEPHYPVLCCVCGRKISEGNLCGGCVQRGSRHE